MWSILVCSFCDPFRTTIIDLTSGQIVNKRSCPSCGSNNIEIQKINYNINLRHSGQEHLVNVPSLELPICQDCKRNIFTEKVDQQIQEAFDKVKVKGNKMEVILKKQSFKKLSELQHGGVFEKDGIIYLKVLENSSNLDV